MNLADFLLARIAEDEAWAHENLPPDAVNYNVPGKLERVLAECEAKRRIVELHSYNAARALFPRGSATEDDWASVSAALATLSALATPYADHPDYREEWRL